jgi:hypothetical protein
MSFATSLDLPSVISKRWLLLQPKSFFFKSREQTTRLFLQSQSYTNSTSSTLLSTSQNKDGFTNDSENEEEEDDDNTATGGSSTTYDFSQYFEIDRLKLNKLLAELKPKINAEDILNVVASKLLSAESAQAINTIQRILKDFPQYGVVDVFSLYPTKDVLSSILALSRIQRASYFYESTIQTDKTTTTSTTTTTLRGTNILSSLSLFGNYNTHPTVENTTESFNHPHVSSSQLDPKDQQLLDDLSHYAVFANAAYGWRMGLLSGKLHMGDLEALLSKTGISREDVIATQFKSKTHLPAYFIVRDVKRRKIVLCIRGTLSAKDILTDLCCTAEDFLTFDDADSTDTVDIDDVKRHRYTARAHHGMLEAARNVAKSTRKIIASELAMNPSYDLVIVGHSLGGGTAAVLGTLWEETFPGVMVYGFGTPCVGPKHIHPTTNKSIISVVGEGDPFSCLSLGHIADISSTLALFCQDHELRNEIIRRSQSNIEAMDEDDLKFCHNALISLRAKLSAEKLYPPGRILYMGGNLFDDDKVTLREVDQDEFQDLRIHRRMFDLSRHIPHRYEAVLYKILHR